MYIAKESEKELVSGLVIICYHPGLNFPVCSNSFFQCSGRPHLFVSNRKLGMGKAASISKFGTFSNCDTAQVQALVVLGIPLCGLFRVLLFAHESHSALRALI